MNKSFVSLAILAALIFGCTSMPPSLNHAGADPSDPSAPESSARRLHPQLMATTKVYLDPSAGRGADKMDMDHSKMPGMESKPAASAPDGMQGMDHSKMPGMEAKQPSTGAPSPEPEGMSGMDHSKMPAMGASPSATAPSPASKEGVEMEMKKTSDEMKQPSDKLKAKSDSGTPPADKAKAAPELAAVFYTCPMHPQIHETKPGQCPICGTTLEKKNGP